MENLIYEKKTVYKKCDKSIIDAAYAYSEGYKAYLDAAKTEREAVSEGVKMAEANGFRPYQFGMDMKAGDKFYYNNFCFYAVGKL